jgi:hypothetical protein
MATTTAARQLIELSVAGYSHITHEGHAAGVLIAIGEDDTVTCTVQSADRSRSVVLTSHRRDCPFFLASVEALRQVNQPAGDRR